MGNATALPAVADAGPIIHLAEIGILHLLRVFSELHVPDAVWAETVDAGRTTAEALTNATKIHRDSINLTHASEFFRVEKFEKLHRGECEALLLCQTLGIRLLLTDDLLVRETAKRFAIVPVGSLGIVVRAQQMGLLDMTQAETHLLALYETSSLFVTRAIVEVAIERLRKKTR